MCIRDSDITAQLVNKIKSTFDKIDAIAGVATAGIPQASLVAKELNLPLVYVRSTAKKHGMKNMIEGELKINSNVLVIEDLISKMTLAEKAGQMNQYNGFWDATGPMPKGDYQKKR